MQEEKRDLSHLYQGLANIIKVAEQNQVDAKIANQSMAETASKLDRIVNEFKNQFQDKVESSTVSITKKSQMI
jgi:tRNA A-37 threonylcarbamoyl transferase component Bud32